MAVSNTHVQLSANRLITELGGHRTLVGDIGGPELHQVPSKGKKVRRRVQSRIGSSLHEHIDRINTINSTESSQFD